jgi:hypothetical protein
MTYLDLWPLLQADILGCLAADPFIGARPGVLVEPGSSAAQLAAKIAVAVGAGQDGKFGVGFLVLPIESARDENANIPFGPLKLPLTVQFAENVVLNNGPRGTGKSLRVYTAVAEKLLKLYTPVGLGQTLTPVNPVIHHFTPDHDANLRLGQLNFATAEADFSSYQKIGRPVLSVAGSAYPYTVTVGTPAAATSVYYTVDGSHPWAGNPAAVLYAAPVSVGQPGLFRARAFAADTVASDTNAQLFE